MRNNTIIYRSVTAKLVRTGSKTDNLLKTKDLFTKSSSEFLIIKTKRKIVSIYTSDNNTNLVLSLFYNKICLVTN